MARDNGFAVADTATSKLNDPKFRRLWRTLQDEAAMNAAVVLHEAVLLASWAAGERVTAEDAAPFWMGDVSAAGTSLQSVGLLDGHGRIPARSWESWFGPARDRRQKRRDAGQLGGRPTKPSKPLGNQMVSNANHLDNDGTTTDNPVPFLPFRTVPTEPDPSDSGAHLPVMAWLRDHGVQRIVGRVLNDLIDFTATDGADALIAAMEQLGPNLDAAQYVYGARNRLHPIPSAPQERQPKNSAHLADLEAAVTRA